MILSRWILAVQYSAVWFHSHSKHRWHHAVQPIVCFFTGCCFLAAHLTKGRGFGFAAGKIALIYGSIFIECCVTAYTSVKERGGSRLPKESMLAERFGLVTLVSLCLWDQSCLTHYLVVDHFRRRYTGLV